MADTPDLKAIDAKMARDDGGYAFPVPMVFDGSVVDTVNERGMSLRDYFAGQAFSIFAHPTWPKSSDAVLIAETAYAIADAMIAERAK